MRLIDADALLNQIYNLSVDTQEYYAILELITNSPSLQREGWISVPIEPTEIMERAGAEAGFISDRRTEAIYKAMIAVAPTDKE